MKTRIGLLVVAGVAALGLLAAEAAQTAPPRRGLGRGDCANEECQGEGRQTRARERQGLGQGEGTGQGQGVQLRGRQGQGKGQGQGQGRFRQGDGQGSAWHRDGTGARKGARDGNCAAE